MKSFFVYRRMNCMKLIITRIEENIVTCELEDGQLLDIARRWFSKDIKENDIIEFDVNKK